jgi:hypothetical protein
MKMNKDETILEEIRRQAFIRAGEHGREEKNRLDTRDTLKVLEQLTGLPRQELETIAANVRANHQPQAKDFFSVKNQFNMVLAGLALSCLAIWAASRLIF